ncbi:MAG: phospho-sugar mutase, partial [Clostridia bacterium]|nr:phospho-sugar mutase [Clostridia bacterium]
IIITASHNPAKYNGYKVYWEDGAQMPPQNADKVLNFINSIDIFGDVKVLDEVEASNSGLITRIGKEVDKAYLENVRAQSINPDLITQAGDALKVVYTPFHGAGNKLVRKILSTLGVSNVFVVREQEDPDPAFSTVKSPNPEDPEGFTYAIKLAKETGAPLIIGTDPDGDRMGLMVRDKSGEYVTLSGNQVGVLLINYILSQRLEKGTLPKDPVVIKTIVTSEMAAVVCRHYGIEITDVLTGFKFIGEIIKNLEEKGEENRFILGYEESYGYLSGTYARDKDAVVATMLTVEMAAWYTMRGMTVYEGLQELFEKFGYYREMQKSFTLEGISGIQKRQEIVDSLRNNPPKAFGDAKVVAVRDYLTRLRTDTETGKTEPLTLPKSDVLYYELSDGTYFVVRPSGTEPKIKFYLFTSGKTKEEADNSMNNLWEKVYALVNTLM